MRSEPFVMIPHDVVYVRTCRLKALLTVGASVPCVLSHYEALRLAYRPRYQSCASSSLIVVIATQTSPHAW